MKSRKRLIFLGVVFSVLLCVCFSFFMFILKDQKVDKQENSSFQAKRLGNESGFFSLFGSSSKKNVVIYADDVKQILSSSEVDLLLVDLVLPKQFQETLPDAQREYLEDVKKVVKEDSFIFNDPDHIYMYWKDQLYQFSSIEDFKKQVKNFENHLKNLNQIVHQTSSKNKNYKAEIKKENLNGKPKFIVEMRDKSGNLLGEVSIQKNEFQVDQKGNIKEFETSQQAVESILN